MCLVMMKTNKTPCHCSQDKKVKNLDLHTWTFQTRSHKVKNTSCHLSRFHTIHINHLPKEENGTHQSLSHPSASKAKFHFKAFPVEVIQALKATTFPREHEKCEAGVDVCV